MVDRLAEAELVERRADPTDRRAWLPHLTPRARTLLDDMRRLTDRLREEAPAGRRHAVRRALTAAVERDHCNRSRRHTTTQTGPTTDRWIRFPLPHPNPHSTPQ